ncbi:MAG: hypothetical protein AB8C13_04740 [Phycisphaerales bacterium]
MQLARIRKVLWFQLAVSLVFTLVMYSMYHEKFTSSLSGLQATIVIQEYETLVTDVEVSPSPPELTSAEWEQLSAPMYRALRAAYGSAVLYGLFSFIVSIVLLMLTRSTLKNAG